MNIGSLLIRFALDTIWVWAFGLAILLFLRMAKRKPVFTERDWLALCGHTRAEVFSCRLLLRFFSLLLVVIALGLSMGQWIAPLGPLWLIGSLLPAAIIVVLVTRWWMR
jgi:hypothetical protein